MRRIARVIAYLLIVLGALSMLIPFVDMIIGALRTRQESVAIPLVFWPRAPQWQNYADVLKALPMARLYLNSLITSGSVTIAVLVTSALTGFALAKYRFRGRDAFFRFTLGTLMFPQFVFLIPVYYLMKRVPLAGGNDWLGLGGSGLLHSYGALVLPFVVSGFGIFLMRQFIMEIPDELLEAARIDGCSELRIFWQIVLPNLKPAMATLAIFTFLGQWNEFIWSMIITTSAPELMTLPVGIQLLKGQLDLVRTDLLMRAALSYAVLPIIGLFVMLQRYYVRGMVMSGMK